MPELKRVRVHFRADKIEFTPLKKEPILLGSNTQWRTGMKLFEFLPMAQELVKKLAHEVNRNNMGLKAVEEQILALIYQVGHELLQLTVDQMNEPTMANAIDVKG